MTKIDKKIIENIELLSKIIEQETMVIPSFSNYDGQFPNSAKKGLCFDRILSSMYFESFN